MAKPTPKDVSYTVFIKFPFPRGTFVDPPAILWNTAKEAELWDMLNSTPKSSGIDWEALAEHFHASPSFLLQQAAWLYERQLSHVREHLSHKHTRQPSISMPTPSSAVAQLMKRAGSGQGTGSRAPSSLSIRPKVSTELRWDGGVNVESMTPPSQRTRNPYSRTTSTTTVTQLQRSPSSQLSPKQRRQSMDHAPGSPLSMAGARRSPTDSSEGSTSSDSEPPAAQSRIYTRRPRFSSSRSKAKASLRALSSADENSDDETPSFLPFSTLSTASAHDIDHTQGTNRRRPTSIGDQSATLRTSKTTPPIDQESSQRTLSATSSGTLSSPQQPSSSMHSTSSPREHQSPSSGSRVLSALSPRQRRIAQEESEGTPSMGSSFSDLDDASISRSAMEEALAREIKAGRGSLGVASRLGGLWRQSGAAGPSAGTGASAAGAKGKGKVKDIAKG